MNLLSRIGAVVVVWNGLSDVDEWCIELLNLNRIRWVKDRCGIMYDLVFIRLLMI